MNDVLKTSGQQRRKLLRLGLAVGAMLPGWPARAEGVKTLRIGFQKGGGLLGMLKAEGKLEQLLAGQGWQLTWHEFPAGPQLLEAMNADSIDFGYTGAPPPIFAQAANKNLLYVGAEPGTTSGEAIVVPPDSLLKQLSELKGKRVAVQKGSSANYLLLAALESARLAYADVEVVYLAPADARAAFQTRRVDAWSIWDPYLAAVQNAEKARVLADYDGLMETHSFYEASRKFAELNPQLVGLVLAELARIGAWAQANPVEVAKLLAPALGLPQDVVEKWQRRSRYGVKAIDAAVISNQQKIADAFFEARLIPVKIDVAKACWTWRKG